MATKQRREAPRVTVNWRAQVSIPNSGIVWARVKNISLGGLSLEISYNVQVGQSLLLKVQAMIKGKIHEMMVRAEVRHTCLLSGNRGTGAGCRFFEVTDETKKQLSTIVQSGTGA
jgi:PilZ domain